MDGEECDAAAAPRAFGSARLHVATCSWDVTWCTYPGNLLGPLMIRGDFSGRPAHLLHRVRKLRSLGTFAEPVPEPEAREPALAELGAVSPEKVDSYHRAWFNTPYHRRWHVVAMQTREPALRSVPCSTCAVLAMGTFARHMLETFQRCRTRS